MKNTLGAMLQFISDRTGERDQELLLREINFAWNEIWSEIALPGSYKRVFVMPAEGSTMVSLPGQVKDVVAMRYSAFGPLITLEQPQNFYGSITDFEDTFRMRLVEHSPIKSQLTGGSKLTLTLGRPTPVAFSVTIEGQTTMAQRSTETVTFDVDDQVATTQNAFGPALTNISKDVRTDSDIVITNDDGTELATLFNAESFTAYVIVRLRGESIFCCQSLGRCLDVLYLSHAPDLLDSNDSVQAPHHLALIDRTVGNILTTKTVGDGQVDPRTNLFFNRAASKITRYADLAARHAENRVVMKAPGGARIERLSRI